VVADIQKIINDDVKYLAEEYHGNMVVSLKLKLKPQNIGNKVN
jgi:hypothetical protein